MPDITVAINEARSSIEDALGRGEAALLIVCHVDDQDVNGFIAEQLRSAVETLIEQGSVPITILFQPIRASIRVVDVRRDL